MINHQSLLTHYGSIDTDDVTTARDNRDLAVVTDLATARPKINALMMYYFLYERLGLLRKRKSVLVYFFVY